MIELKSLIQPDCILHPLKGTEPQTVIRELVELLHDRGRVQDPRRNQCAGMGSGTTAIDGNWRWTRRTPRPMLITQKGGRCHRLDRHSNRFQGWRWHAGDPRRIDHLTLGRHLWARAGSGGDQSCTEQK